MRRCTIPRRINWRHHSNALSQCEVALVANIQLSANECISFIFFLLLFIKQMAMIISGTRRAMIGGPKSPLIRWMLHAVMYYNCLLTFCFHELDVLIESDDVLMNVHASQEIHIFNKPPCNRTLDALSEEDSYPWTRFHK